MFATANVVGGSGKEKGVVGKIVGLIFGLLFANASFFSCFELSRTCSIFVNKVLRIKKYRFV